MKKKKTSKKKLKSSFIRFRDYKSSKYEEKKEKNYNDKYNLNKNRSVVNENFPYKKIIRPKKVIKRIKNHSRVAKLEKYLSHVGENLYIEEENMNNNLISKYTKSKYILSTITMIDNLLSKDFQGVLMKMDNIEITKPKEEIKSMIEKIILSKRVKLFNSSIENKNRVRSAYTIYRKNNNMMNENEKTMDVKSSTIKDSIINNNSSFKKLPYFRNDKKDSGFNTCSSREFKPKNKLSISQMMSGDYKFKNRLLKESITKNNESAKEIHYRLKSSIERGYEKNHYNNNYGQIIKYPMDRGNFSKNQIKKKRFLDKLLDKELDFQKQLLNSKINENKDISEIDYFNQKSAFISAERDFDIMLNVQKSNYGDKFISNLFSMKQIKVNNNNSNIAQKKQKKFKKNDLLFLKMSKDKKDGRNKNKTMQDISELNLKKAIFLKNEDDMKKLSVECADLSYRKKQLETQRRNIILNLSKSKLRKNIFE